ncbi:MAG: hypothetical protein ACJ72D_05230 [Marmoricola sp.]
MRVRPLAALLCATALVLTAAGCGGGDSEKKKVDPAKAALTAYQDKVNKICQDTLVDIQKIGKGLTAQSPTADKDAAFAGIGDAFLAEITVLRAVKPPAAIATDVTAWLAAFTTAATKTKTQGSKLLEQGTPSPFADSDAKATALGLTGCSSGTS